LTPLASGAILCTGALHGARINYQLDSSKLDHGCFDDSPRLFHPRNNRTSGSAAPRELNGMEIINFGLMKHPMNWLTIILMVLIAGVAVHLVLQFAGVQKTTD
jgi:hypothetical protein